MARCSLATVRELQELGDGNLMSQECAILQADASANDQADSISVAA
jgi:hypothetical protein